MNHKVLVNIFVGVAVLLLWQNKTAQPIVKGIGILLVLALVLGHYDTIASQFKALGTHPKSTGANKPI